MPQIIVKPSAILGAVGFTAGLFVFYCVHLFAVGQGAAIQSPPATFFLISALAFGAVLFVHEMGHVVAYRVLGLRWHRVTIGHVPSVGTDDHRTYCQQLLVSAAGPLAEVVLGIMVLSLAGFDWSPLSLVAAFAAINGLGGLVLPQGRNSDSAKIYRCVWALLRGRSDQDFS